MVQKNFFFLFLLFASFSLWAQKPETNYNSYELFQPNFYPSSVNEYRAADGQPGPKYWTNRADYKMDVTLDELKDEVSGSVVISYTNNSPHELNFLWLYLDQNLFSASSRGQAKTPATGRSRYGDVNSTFDGGFKLKNVKLMETVKGKATESAADTLITDTRMQIRLKNPLAANGGNIKIRIEYSFVIPDYGADRTGIQNTKNGKMYAVAQWYPRMCVYDDILGWNTLPYLGASEFYLDYGDYEYNITAPASMIVAGAGDLLNAREVLSAKEYQRYEQAKKSDQTVLIRTPEEVENPMSRPAKETLTWKFALKNSRDVAWAASRAFILDGAKINLPSGRNALALSVYPVESKGNNGWERSTEYTKACIESYSQQWYEYPYNTAVNVAGNVGGMEYPAIVFCSWTSKGGSLWSVTNHEFGHTWFPMIVGSDERKYGWMDEGFNTFINDIATQEFNGGEYAQSQYVADQMIPFMFSPTSETVMSTPDALREVNIGMALYFKPAYALNLLRNEVLGEKRFDFAFREYIRRWAYKHPTPWDFFRTMENAAGEDLSWFWKGMFINNYRLDQAITDVKYLNGNEKNGALITISNLGEMVMPVTLTYETITGKKGSVKIPVEVWQNGGRWIERIKTNEKLNRVEIDEKRAFPDINRSNNRWTAGSQ